MSMPPAAHPLHRNLRVLVVDDDEFQRDYITDLLQEIGIQDPASAADGVAALAQISDSEMKFDLIICDVRMPVMDGFELLSRLAENKFSGAVIIASGQDQTVVDYASLVAELASFNYLGELKKPLTKRQLELLIDKLN